MKRVRVEIIAIFNCLLWGSAFVPTKFCLSIIDPMVLAVIRLVISLIFISFFLKENPFRIEKDKFIWAFLVSILKVGIFFSLFNIALSMTSSSVSAIVIGSSPTFSIIIAVILIKEEHLNKYKLTSIVISLIAIVLLALSKNSSSSNASIKANILGIVLLLITNISIGVSDVIVKKKMSDVSQSKIAFSQIFISIPILFIISLFTGSYSDMDFSNISLLTAILYLSFITATTTLLWIYIISQKNVNLSDIAIWKLLTPSFGAILSWILIKDDKPTILSIVALGLIMLSIFISTKSRKV